VTSRDPGDVRRRGRRGYAWLQFHYEIRRGRLRRAARSLERALDRDSRLEFATYACSRLDIPVGISTPRGIWFVQVGDDISKQLLEGGVYEEGTSIAALHALERAGLLERKPWVVIAGANIGTTVVPFVAAGYQVLAIEPIALTRNLLLANLAVRRMLSSVRVAACAIDESEGEVSMSVSQGLGQSEVLPSDGASATYVARQLGTERHHEVVRASRLGAILEECGVSPASVSMVFSDVQGHEAAVVATGVDLWADGTLLVCEVWPTALERHGGLHPFLYLVGKNFSQFAIIDGARVGDFRPIDGFAAEILNRPKGDRWSRNVILVP
jgi:FkbM family methyltransferase